MSQSNIPFTFSEGLWPGHRIEQIVGSSIRLQGPGKDAAKEVSFTASQLAKRSKDNKEFEKETKKLSDVDVKYYKRIVREHLKKRFAADDLKFPMEISFWCNAHETRGLRLTTDATPEKLRPIFDEVLKEFTDDKTELFVEKQVDPTAPSSQVKCSDCDWSYCGHGGSLVINHRDIANPLIDAYNLMNGVLQ